MTFHLKSNSTSIVISVDCVQNKPAFFAKRLHNAGLETDYDVMIRIIIGRAETDLGSIKEEYQKIYGVPLTKYFEDEYEAGNNQLFMKLMLELIGL